MKCVAIILLLVTLTNAYKLTLVKEEKSQSDAESYCASKDLILVRDSSKAKHDQLLDVIKANGLTNSHFRINGDIKSSKEIDCSDGTKLTKYLPWASGQPDGSGTSLQLWAAKNFDWDDTLESLEKYFICEEPDYVLVKEKKSYDDAESYCESKGMILAKDTSDNTHNAIKNLASANGASSESLWVNGNPIVSKSSVICSDGDKLDQYSKWKSTQPDGSGSCLQLWGAYGHAWDDTPCSNTKYFVCGRDDRIRILTAKKKYIDALNDCEARGMTLFKDTSCYTHNAVLEKLSNEGMSDADVWINGNPVKDSIVITSDGDNLDCYQPWSSNNPSGNGACLQLWAYQGQAWDDDDCNNPKQYVCQKD